MTDFGRNGTFGRLVATRLKCWATKVAWWKAGQAIPLYFTVLLSPITNTSLAPWRYWSTMTREFGAKWNVSGCWAKNGLLATPDVQIAVEVFTFFPSITMCLSSSASTLWSVSTFTPIFLKRLETICDAVSDIRGRIRGAASTTVTWAFEFLMPLIRMVERRCSHRAPASSMPVGPPPIMKYSLSSFLWATSSCMCSLNFLISSRLLTPKQWSAMPLMLK